MRFHSRPAVLPALGLWLLVAPASAQVARVFVSIHGNDANTCSNVATPCRTFSGAIAQVDPAGEVIVLATGTYGGTTITKSVTINVPHGIVAFTAQAFTVNAPGSSVVLRGLTINGAGAASNGINVVAAAVLRVESCLITGFTGAALSPTAGNGLFFGSAGQLFVKDTIVRTNSGVGIWVMPASGSAKASIDRCRLEGNMYGLESDLNAVTTIRDSVASGQSWFGLFAEIGGELNIDNCVAANNGIGIDSHGLIRVANSTVTGNGSGLFESGSLLSLGNNTVEGNDSDGAFSGSYAAR
jgi:hypothetical protein